MKKGELEKKTNSELLVLQKQKRDEFDKVKTDIVRLYDYWMSIESDYIQITEVLNKRNIKKENV
jgi:uncharacterized protein YqgQ